MERYRLEDKIRYATSRSEIAGVYWSSRDMDPLFLGNHHFFTFIYDSEEQARRITGRWTKWQAFNYQRVVNDAGLYIYFTTVGLAERDDICFLFNPNSDMMAIYEVARGQNTDILSPDKDYQSVRIPLDIPSVAYTSYEDLIYDILEEVFKLNKHHEYGKRAVYDLDDQNCASGVNTIMKRLGYPQADREEMGEFWGIDWAEEQEIPSEYFDMTFIGNSNTHELHAPYCEYIKRMNPIHVVEFVSMYDALATGYNGCAYCMSELDTDIASPTAYFYKLHLISLVCRTTEDWTGADDVYLRADGMLQWGPVAMNNNDTVSLINVPPIYYKPNASQIVLALYDRDTNYTIVVDANIDENDLLGEDTIGINLGEGKSFFDSDGANYELTYRVAAYYVSTGLPVDDRVYNLELISLKCNETEDITGDDSAYLTVNGVKVWGVTDMNNGDFQDLTSVPPVLFDQRAEIKLYDQDGVVPFDDDDCLGTVIVNSSESDSGERSVSFTNDDASYVLKYRVVPHVVTDDRRLTLVKLKCKVTEDSTGSDEAYLQVNGELIWGPVSINDGEEANLQGIASIPFQKSVRLDLYDQDGDIPFDDDDHLGTYFIRAEEVGTGDHVCEFNKDDAQYDLTYRVES